MTIKKHNRVSFTVLSSAALIDAQPITKLVGNAIPKHLDLLPIIFR
ncbi:MAG: hypothetical protein ACK518_01240 [bacterium]